MAERLNKLKSNFILGKGEKKFLFVIGNKAVKAIHFETDEKSITMYYS